MLSSGKVILSGYWDNDIIAESATEDVPRKKRVVVGPTPDWAVSYEKTTRCTIIEGTPLSFIFMQVVGLVTSPVGLRL